MEIKIEHKNETVISIYAIGEMDSSEDSIKLKQALEEAGTREINITFFHANLLDVKVVDILARLQQNDKCKVYVVRRYLHSYLYSLGIQCRYMIKKSEFKTISVNNKLTAQEELNKGQVKGFLEEILIVYGYDYTRYQIDSIMRRIKICMLRTGITDFNAFRHSVLDKKESFEELFLDLSINTTDFFRDPEVFEAFKTRIVPYLKTYNHIRIWCAGCSNGKEPYSLAILLKEAGLLEKTQIYATDINHYIIEDAKNGLFSIDTLEKDIKNYRQAGGSSNFVNYFKLNGSYMKIDAELQKNILFFQHSLIGSGVLNEFQLILCRNVLIYFNMDLQRSVLEYLYNSLDLNGFLILGKSGGGLHNGGNELFNKYDDINKIYKHK